MSTWSDHRLVTLAFALLGAWGCHDGLDLAGGTDGGSCAALSESACRTRSDCVADTCLECSCTPTFVGCRTTAGAPHVCPALGCKQPECCHEDGDCVQAGLCQVPPIDEGCGICAAPGPSTCQTDNDCTTPGEICDPMPCACASNVLTCLAGCTLDSDCPEPQTCGGLRCHDRPCDSTCVGNYACSAGTCTRKACSSDGDCDVPGFCIDHACSRNVGQCVEPAA